MPLNQTDLVPFHSEALFVTNNTLFVCDAQCQPVPNLTFPFSRMSCMTTASTTRLYHQLNESVILEEIHDDGLPSTTWFEPNMIVIPTN